MPKDKEKVVGETPEQKKERKDQEKALLKKAQQNALYTRSALRLSVTNIYKAIFLLALLQLVASALQIALVVQSTAGPKGVGVGVILGLVITEAVFNIIVQFVLVVGYVKVSRKILHLHIYGNYAATVISLIFAAIITGFLNHYQNICNNRIQSTTEGSGDAKLTDLCSKTLLAYQQVLAPLWFAVTVAIMLSLASAAGVERITRERKHFEFVKMHSDQKKATASARKELKIFYKKGLTPARLGLLDHLSNSGGILRKNKEDAKKIFLSYAWYVEEDMNTVLQSRLKKIKSDLQKFGCEVRLDLTDMHGGIDEYMKKGIEWADHVLLICTPRLKERSAQTNNNNLIKEVRQALGKHHEIAARSAKFQFIIPLLFDGTPATAVPDNVEGKGDSTITALRPIDLSMENMESIEQYDAKYAESMSSVSPAGLLTIMHPVLERDQDYATSLSQLEKKLADAAAKEQAEKA